MQRVEDDQLDAAPTYYFHASGMKEVLAGLDRKTVLEGLVSEGVVVRPEGKAGAGASLNKVFKVPSEKSSMRLYQINLAALTAEADEADG